MIPKKIFETKNFQNSKSHEAEEEEVAGQKQNQSDGLLNQNQSLQPREVKSSSASTADVSDTCWLCCVSISLS